MTLLVLTESTESERRIFDSLLDHDYGVVFASDTRQALAILARPKHPEVVIVRWPFPDNSWIQVCRLIQAGRRDGFVYVLLFLRKGAQLPVADTPEWADDIVSEPCESHELMVRVRAGFRVWQLQSELRTRQHH